MSKLLTYDQIRICIRTNLCHEIRIQRMQIFLRFVTTLVLTALLAFRSVHNPKQAGTASGSVAEHVSGQHLWRRATKTAARRQTWRTDQYQWMVTRKEPMMSHATAEPWVAAADGSSAAAAVTCFSQALYSSSSASAGNNSHRLSLKPNTAFLLHVISSLNSLIQITAAKDTSNIYQRYRTAISTVPKG